MTFGENEERHLNIKITLNFIEQKKTWRPSKIIETKNVRYVMY